MSSKGRKKKSNNKSNNKVKIIIAIIAILIVSLGALYLLSDKSNKNDGNGDKKVTKVTTTKAPEKKLNIVDVNSKSRPIAVMINNHGKARPYHSGLQDAIIVYEMIVEGGISRYMAIFKDANTAKIGSVRSSRHYYLDYALENDAIYVHFGWSPQAQSDIKSLKVNNINGLTDSGFVRDKSLGISSEHTAYTSMESISTVANKKKYRTTSDEKTLLNYSIDEVDLSKLEGAILANNVSIQYSSSLKSTYQYNEESKTYLRSVNGTPHKDYVTGKQYTFKNIITYQVANSSIKGDDKGRQTLDNIGSGEGYYISNGYAVPITWSKSSRSSKTVYKYKNGKEIDVNDGNTFIQIQPKNKELVIN